MARISACRHDRARSRIIRRRRRIGPKPKPPPPQTKTRAETSPPKTRINAHESGPPHPHLAMAVGTSIGGAAAMGRRVHRAAATSRCNGSPPSPPRQSDLSVYCARCDGESESILLHTRRLLLRPRLRRICSRGMKRGGGRGSEKGGEVGTRWAE